MGRPRKDDVQRYENGRIKYSEGTRPGRAPQAPRRKTRADVTEDDPRQVVLQARRRMMCGITDREGQPVTREEAEKLHLFQGTLLGIWRSQGKITWQQFDALSAFALARFLHRKAKGLPPESAQTSRYCDTPQGAPVDVDDDEMRRLANAVAFYDHALLGPGSGVKNAVIKLAVYDQWAPIHQAVMGADAIIAAGEKGKKS